MAEEFLLANPVIRVSADTAKALRQIEGMERGADAALKRLGRRMNDAGQKMATVGRGLSLATAPFVATITKGVHEASKFEKSLSEIKAIGGLTADQIALISEKAKTLGRDTKFTATDALAAFQDMVKDGREVEEMMGSIDAVFAGAAASGESLGQTQVFLSDTMDMFGIATEGARDAMQSIIAATVTSPADFGEMARALRNAGSSAATLGIPLEDVNAALVVLAKQGRRGEEAGTQLRQFFDYLTPATDKAATAMAAIGVDAFDAQGNFVGLGEVIEQFREGLADLSQEQKTVVLGDIFGIRARQAAQLLINYDMTLDDIKVGMEEAAEMEAIAAEQMDNFAGSVMNLRSSMQIWMIERFAPFMDKVLRPLVDDFLIPFVDRSTEFARNHPELSLAITTITVGLAGLGIVLMGVGTAMTLIAPTLPVLGAALGLLNIPVLLLAGGFGALLALLTNFGGIRTKVEEALSPLTTVLGGIAGDMLDVIETEFGLEDGAIATALKRPFVSFVDYVTGLFEPEGALGELHAKIDSFFSKLRGEDEPAELDESQALARYGIMTSVELGTVLEEQEAFLAEYHYEKPKARLEEFADWIDTTWKESLLEKFTNVVGSIANLVRDEDGELGILDSLKAPFNKFKGWVSDLWPGSPKVTDVIRDSYVAQPHGIIPTIEALDDLVQNPLKAPFMGFKTWLGEQKFEAPEVEARSSPFQDLSLWDDHLKSPMESLVESVEDFLNMEEGGLVGALKQPFLTLGDWISSLWENHLKSPFETLKDSIAGFFSAETGIGGAISEALAGLSAAIFGEGAGATGGRSRLRAGQRAGGTALRLQSDLATLPKNLGRLLKDLLRLDWDRLKRSASLVGKQSGRAGLRGITGMLAAEGDETIPEAILSAVIATRFSSAGASLLSGAKVPTGFLGEMRTGMAGSGKLAASVGQSIANWFRSVDLFSPAAAPRSGRGVTLLANPQITSLVDEIFTPLTDDLARASTARGATAGTSVATSWWRSLLGSFDDFFRAGKVGPALLKGAGAGAGMMAGPAGFVGGFLLGDTLVGAAFDTEFRQRVKDAAIAIRDAFIQEAEHLDAAGAAGGVGGLLDAVLLINADDVDYEALTASIGAIFERLVEIAREKVENLGDLIFGEQVGTTGRSLGEIIGGTFLTALNLARGVIYTGISKVLVGIWDYLSGQFWSFDTNKVGSIGWIVKNVAMLTGTILTVLLAEAKNIIDMVVAPVIEGIGSSIRDRIVRSFIGETVTVGDHLAEGFTESLAAGTVEVAGRRQGLFWAGLGDLFEGGIDYLDQLIIQPIRDWGADIGPKIQEALSPFVNAARNVFRFVFRYPLLLLQALPGLIIALLTGASPALAKGTEALTGGSGGIMAEGIGDALTGTGGGQSVTGAIEESGKSILDALIQPFLDFADWIRTAWEKYISEPFNSLVESIVGAFAPITGAISWIGEQMSSVFGGGGGGALTDAELAELKALRNKRTANFGLPPEEEARLRELESLKNRAMGGPVSANRPYMVGERGPELFLPRVSGQIIPNHELAGAGGPTINITIHNAQNMNEEQLARRIRHEVEGALFRVQDRRY